MGQFCRAQHKVWKDNPTEANHQGKSTVMSFRKSRHRHCCFLLLWKLLMNKLNRNETSGSKQAFMHCEIIYQCITIASSNVEASWRIKKKKKNGVKQVSVQLPVANFNCYHPYSCIRLVPAPALLKLLDVVLPCFLETVRTEQERQVVMSVLESMNNIIKSCKEEVFRNPSRLKDISDVIRDVLKKKVRKEANADGAMASFVIENNDKITSHKYFLGDGHASNPPQLFVSFLPLCSDCLSGWWWWWSWRWRSTGWLSTFWVTVIFIQWSKNELTLLRIVHFYENELIDYRSMSTYYWVVFCWCAVYLRRSMMPCFRSLPERESPWWPLLSLQTTLPPSSTTCCLSSWTKLWVWAYWQEHSFTEGGLLQHICFSEWSQSTLI